MKTNQPIKHEPALTHEERTALREIIQWWRTKGHKEATAPAPQFRPKLKGESRATSIRVNSKLQRLAVRKANAREERPKTFGNLSGLVEYLLFQYLGCPEELLDEGNELNEDEE